MKTLFKIKNWHIVFWPGSFIRPSIDIRFNIENPKHSTHWSIMFCIFGSLFKWLFTSYPGQKMLSVYLFGFNFSIQIGKIIPKPIELN